MTDFQILGIGTALPLHSISQQGAAKFAATAIEKPDTPADRVAGLVQGLYRRAGVQTRHSVLLESSSDEEATAERFYRTAQGADDRGPGTAERMSRYELEAAGLATQAAQTALADANVTPQAITHLITVSCSGFYAPGVDIQLQQQLEMRPTISRTHLGFMGCHGALNGLRVAQAFAGTDPAAMVMVCAVELCSLHHQYGWDPQNIVANSLFADGAAAVIGRADSSGRANRNVFPGRLIESYSRIVPNTDRAMTWRIGDHGFEMTLGPEVPVLIQQHLPAAVDEFLGRHQLARGDIRSWAIHPGGPRIVTAVADALGLSAEACQPSLDVLRRCGNMSSPTLLFVLDELRRRSASLPGVLLGFGPGLNVELALLD